MTNNSILHDNIVTYEELTEHFTDIGENKEAYQSIIEKYPMSITRYYLSLADKKDINDPIRKMCIPSLSETAMLGEFDTSGEKDNTVLSGLQHKYKHTVIILSTNNCALYCRYCFRKRMVGLSNHETLSQREKAFNYIKQHKEINNVLISGGDSLLNNNATIESYLKNLCELEHLDFIRLATKIPVVLPQRISEDQELLDILNKYNKKKQLYVVTQFNHPKELTPQVQKAIRCLQSMNIIVKNQSVLLKGVNDNPDVLAKLLHKLTSFGIVPYYIFQCRPVMGVQSQFQIPIKKGYEIIEKAKMMQNGQGKCFKYVLSNRSGKIEIVGNDSDGQMLFKYHEAKDYKQQGTIFKKNIATDECWIE